MSQFSINDSRSTSSRNSTPSDDDDPATLPFAAPLPRPAFLSPHFSAPEYLSTLSNRHQTLEDLRAELRARSQLLNKELLDLVNSNYHDFLDLGNSLHGGEEKVEEVRVGLLGFRKEVAALRDLVGEREAEVAALVEERRAARSRIEVGRRLVGFEERLRELEGELVVETAGREASVVGEEVEDSDEDEDEDEDEEDDEGAYGVSIAKLRRTVMQYRVILEMQKSLDEHPFVLAQVTRIAKVRSTLLMDLSTALQQAKSAGASGTSRVVKVMKIYADMDESAEAVKVLKSSKA
ncbi:hypothetical protein NX059_010045 [Plenodomus lindquistii]|nr:hypothetical protein NX059_010045 [Plenodomus lindquistii]